MPDPDTPTPPLYHYRLPLVVWACGLTLGWLLTLYTFPHNWNDQHGYNWLLACIVASVLHGAFGALLLLAAVARVVRARFALVVGMAPIAHFRGRRK